MSSNIQEFDTLEEAQAALAASQPAVKKPYGRSVVETIYPGVSVTSDYRGPNHPLSKKNPGSFHAKGDRAVDVRAIPGMTFEQYLDGINAKGYDILEYRDEYTNPSPHSTGPHWHVVIGEKREKSFEEFDTLEEAQAALQQTSKAAPPAGKKEPWKPRTFNQEVAPKAQLSEAEIGKVNYQTDYVLNDDQEVAVRDIQNRLFAARGRKSGQEIIDEIKKDYGRLFPNMTDDDLRYAVQYYQNGGKAPVDFFASGTNQSESTAKPGDAAVKAPPPLSPIEVAARRADEMFSETGAGVNAALIRGGTRLLKNDKQDEAYAAEVRDKRAGEQAFWEDQANRTENPILDAIGGFAGDMVGDINPTYAIAPGESAIGRIVGQGLVNAGTDIPTQLAEMQQGVRDEYSMEQTAINAAAGAVFQGGVEGLGKLLQGFAKERGSKVEVEPDGTPYVSVETPEGLVKVYNPSAPITKKAQLLTGASRVVPDARPQEVSLSTSFKDKGNVDAEIARTTAEWKSAPEFTTYQKFDDLPEDQKFTIMRDTGNRPQDVKAWTDSEGKVHVIADHLDGPEDIPAIAFHEALGHVGLSRQFEARLDRVLADAYRTNPDLQARVDAWFDEGGQIPDSVDSPTSRATEEVLAEQSELGQIDATLYDKIKNILKDYARRVGIDLKYSDREIRTLLAMAHSKVIGRGGSSKVTQSGNKYIRVYHGSAADFDRFSRDKEFTGEGVDAYGSGLYFTETRDIADQYRRKLADWQDGSGQNQGKLYEVDLPDDMQWLAWDFQPSDVEKAKLKKLGVEYAGRDEVRALYDDYYKTQQKMMDIEDAMNALRDEKKAFRKPENYDEAMGSGWEDVPTPQYAKLLADLRDAETAIMFLQHELDNASPTGETIYRQLTTRLGSKRAASKALEEAGFDGVKYLDGFSRDAGEGSHNYVVFNDEKPTIVNKYIRKKTPKEKKAEAAAEKKARNFANSVNLDKLDSTVEISAVLKAVEKDIPKTRVTHDEVRAFAEENGLTFKEVRDWAAENGGGRLLAARQLLVRSAERVMVVAKAIDEGDNSPITRRVFAQRMATHRVIQEKISNKISDAARTLNSLKVVADNGGDVEAVRYAMEKSGDDVVKNLFTEEAAAAFAKNLLEHKDSPAATTKVMKDAFSHLPEDYIISFRYNMMLYGLGTHVKNAMGNAGLMYTDIIEHGLASAIGQWKRLTPRERISTRETMSRVMGTFEALAEAGTYREAMKSYAEGKPTHSISKIEVGQNLFTNKIGGAGHLIEAPARMLSMSDSFFRSLLEQSSYNGLAHRKAMMEGLKGEEYRARVAELKANPTNEMRAMADEHAAIQQLVDEPSSAVRWIEKGKARPANKTNYGHRALRFALHIALPFSRVTDRLFWAAVRRVPIVGMLDHVNRADWAAGGARRDMVLARMVMGAAIISYLNQKFDDDELSGNGPKNYDKKAQMEAEGWQPNSIKFGDTWYSLAGFDSVAPLASFVVHIKQAMKDKEFDEAGYIGKTLDLIGAAGNAFTDNTFAEQIASLFAMAGGGPMAENAAENYFTNMEKSFIPAGVRQAAEISDGKVRDATGDGTIEGKLEGGIISSTPGYREGLPIRHDVYGREVDSNKNIFSVFQSKKESNDPVILEIKRLTKVNDDKPLVTPSGRKSLEAALKVKKLDASIIQEYQKLAGTYIYESLKEYTSSPDWQGMTDEEKIKQVKKITTAQRKFAREDLFEGLDEKGDNDE